MQIKIPPRTLGGTEFPAKPPRQHMGAQNAEGVDRLVFQLPAEWAGCSVTLHIRHSDGTLAAPLVLDAAHSAPVGRSFTGWPAGQWMLAATDGSGYTAYTRPGRYDVYDILPTDGTEEEPSPSVYEQFIAQVSGQADAAVQAAQNSAASEANAARQAQAAADAADALDYACALEMLHCYSLIHDDMPCMDNDDFRRGRPSCHKQFGEATALLAADALVTAAFEVLANAKCSAESRIEAVQLLARGGGDRGMLYGQELDKHFETVRAGEADLLNLHAHKTGALIIAAVELGCAAAGVRPDTDTRKALVRYAAELGLVFQIVDDILDVTSTTEELGKPVGSDADNDKTTFITLYGLQGAHEEAERHNTAALAALDALGPGADFLRLMAAELLERKK